MRAPLAPPRPVLIGRDADRRRVEAALAENGVICLWGPAGVGKSALARELAGPDALEVDLEGIDPGDVLDVLAATLGVDAGPEAPRAAQVDRALACAPSSVLLDGAEEVDESLRALLARGRTGGGAPLLVTRRSPLELEGLRDVEIGPLATEDAVALWRDATARHGLRSEGELAERIVERLDRLPAALEHAAGRAALLGEEACLARLEATGLDSDPLRVTLLDSLDALPAADREVLARVVTYAQGCPVDALEGAVVDGLGAVERLARRSLIRLIRDPPGPARALAYHPVRGLMQERLAREGSLDALLRDHAERTIGRASGRLGAPLRAGLAAVRARFDETDPELALRAALLLAPSERVRGAADVARARLARLLASVGPTSGLVGRARLALASLDRLRGDYATARVHAEAVLVSEPELRFEALLERAHLDRQESRLEEALAGCAEAAELARGSADRAREAIARGEQGRLLQSLGRPREAIPHHTEAVALCHAAQAREREALERSLHARATHRAGEVEAAIPLHERALAMHEAAGDRRLAAAERGHLAFCHHEAGSLDEAEALFRASVDGLAEVGDVVLEHIERVLLARLLSDRSRLGEARLELALARAVSSALDLPRLALTAHLVAGLVAWRDERPQQAEAEWRAGLALGPLHEVGFEVLLPALAALASARTGGADVRELLEAGRSRVAALDHAGIAAAFAVLEAAALGEPIEDVAPEVRARSSDARRALELAGGSAEARLVIAPDGRHARLPDGTEVDLRRRSAPRKILCALAEARRETPGEALGRDALIAAGWPGERMLPEAAGKRLRTAIWTLRKAGLAELLLTRDDGYLLDPVVPMA